MPDTIGMLVDWFQLTAARRRLDLNGQIIQANLPVSTHSRPKAAGRIDYSPLCSFMVSTHSRPKAAGLALFCYRPVLQFQLTAARRRLAAPAPKKGSLRPVSTHSRPKAAGPLSEVTDAMCRVSTHSRPKAAGLGC